MDKVSRSYQTMHIAVKEPPKSPKQLPQTHESHVMFKRGLELMTRNHLRDAMTHFEAALQISPDNALYLSHCGLCVALYNEDFDLAMKLCKRAIRLDPRDTTIRVNLGKVHRLRGDNARAHETFLRAWKDNRSHPLPAAELTRMGVRRPPVLPFLSRSNWLNIRLGRLRARLERGRS